MPSTPTDTGLPPRSVAEKLLIRSWEYRHPHAWVAVRVICGAWNVILGILLLAYGFYWIGLAPLAGSALIFWTAYVVQRGSVQRVHELEQSRAHVVDDTAARLRRIERDLHDGPQAQMVAVAMKLGLAREKLADAVSRAPRRPTWSGLWNWSRRPTAGPRRPSSSSANWPAASTPQSWTRGSAPRSVLWPRAAACRRAGYRPARAAIGRDRDHRLLLRGRADHQRSQAQRRPAGHAGGGEQGRAAAGAGQRRRLRRRPGRGPRRPGRTGRAGPDRGRPAAAHQPALRSYRGYRRATVPGLTVLC